MFISDSSCLLAIGNLVDDSCMFDTGISAFSVARRSPALGKGPMLYYLETRALAMDGPVTWHIKGDLC